MKKGTKIFLASLLGAVAASLITSAHLYKYQKKTMRRIREDDDAWKILTE